MSLVVGVDVGGTFTDAFAIRDDGIAASAKAPSTPPDFGDGFMDALAELARSLGTERSQMLDEAEFVIHATTTTLNALITGNVAEVGFLTTKGHADSIRIMNLEGRYLGLGPERIQDMFSTTKPGALVSRDLTKEIVERVDHKGAVVVELDEDAAREAIQDLLDRGVKAIAVSLLWSFLNPVHEQRLRDLIAEMDPEVFVALSSEISPRIREYPRNATTIMSTQVAPTLAGYLANLTGRLSEDGLKGPLLIMQGSGGSVTASEAPRKAISTVGGVLTGGLVGTVSLMRQLDHRNAIATDVGGTTFLVGLAVDKEPLFATTTVLNQHKLNVPMVQVSSIGSGGGAIAWIDPGGNLKVGPNSAGAQPGPACYGQGGEDPTVTDANLVLGIINPDFFLGGRKSLSKELAEEALRKKVGEPLGLDAQRAAAAVFAVQNAQTSELTRRVVVQAGYDPRDFVLYAFGGAGPIHCHAYSANLGVQDVVVPLGAAAATFSAFGLTCSDVIATGEISDPSAYPVDPARANRNFEQLEAELRDEMDRQGIDFAEIRLRREVDIRYTAQLAEVSTPVPDGVLDEDAMAGVVASFEELYERLYGRGAGYKEAGYQVITYRVFAVGVLPVEPQLPSAAEGERPDLETAVKERRPVFLDVQRGFDETAIYDYSALRPGHRLEGPAVIEEVSTTVVIPRSATGEIDDLGNVHISSNGAQA